MSHIQNLFGLNGTALVTGGNRGLGKTMAISLAKAGARIILVQRDATFLGTLKEIEAAGGTGIIVEADLSNRAHVSGLVEKVLAIPGVDSIDILLNCAGIQRRNPVGEFTMVDWDEVIQVNLTTVFTLCRDVGNHMISMRKAQGSAPRPRGKIINVASVLSYSGGLTVPAYASSKAALLGLTKSFSNEWSSQEININCIAPGYIATDMNDAIIGTEREKTIMDRVPIKRWGSVEDFEGIVVFLSSKASDFVCGESIIVDGGWMGR